MHRFTFNIPLDVEKVDTDVLLLELRDHAAELLGVDPLTIAGATFKVTKETVAA